MSGPKSAQTRATSRGGKRPASRRGGPAWSRKRIGLRVGDRAQRSGSPFRGARHLTEALALVRRLPATLAALEAGAISEWRAEIVVRETAVLTTDQQRAVDAELFDGLGLEAVLAA